MRTVNVSEAQNRLYKLIDETAVSRQPVLITGKRDSAVLISEESLHATNKSLYLVPLPGMRESLREELDVPLEERTNELDW